METFDHKEVEKNAQKKWAELNLYETDLNEESKDPYYLLVEFPYPSGNLHIGHWYAYAVTDIYARMLRMRGKNVLFPIGFDAFGLPAENAAIKHNLNPKEWTYQNIEHMRSQIASIGTSFDWSKEVITCESDYYQWTQWIFTKFFEHGLAEHREAPVKWCPKDQTVLANEQVVDGHCERCGTEIKEKILTQWFLKITNYADRLLEGLEKLPWREEIKEAQRSWIGKSEGSYLEFALVERNEKIRVFTTRPDTVFGATYVVIAPEHPFFSDKQNVALLTNVEEVNAYIDATKKKTERERSENKDKTGVLLMGIQAINPATKEEIPVYVADYVLGSYGTGAVMAVPAHDERDFEFANKMNLEIRQVVTPAHLNTDNSSHPYTGRGVLINSGDFSGRQSEEAMWDIVAKVGGERATQYRIRDWLVSRQRYWGCPIPIVYDPEGKPHTIPAEHLPWVLPTDVDFTPTGESPLASSKELRERVINIFGEGWTPEFDTLDTFVDSSWYFARYLDSKNTHSFSNQVRMKKWLPVDRYSGGSEHTTMHVLYARFFIKALYDLDLVPVDEPFMERFNRGLILGPDGQKMSKSKGNVLNPDEFVQKYGADAVRIYLAFIGPYNEPGNYPWRLEGVASMRKFLDRIVRVVTQASEEEVISDALARSFAQASVKISDDGDRFKFNTAIAALMTLLNEIEKVETISKETARALIKMLAPFAPHLAEYLWENLDGEGSVHSASWPVYDKALLEKREHNVAIQVNGKLRCAVTFALGISEEEVLSTAQALPIIKKTLEGKTIKRVIYIPGKILNLVV